MTPPEPPSRAKMEQYVVQNMRHLSRNEALQVTRLVQVRDINAREDWEPGEAPPADSLIVSGGSPLAVNLDALEDGMLLRIHNIVHACLQRLSRPASS